MRGRLWIPAVSTLAALLALGVAITIASAWSLPWMANFQIDTYGGDQNWAVNEQYSYLRLEEFGYRMGPFDLLARRTVIRYSSDLATGTRVDSVGWPWPCLHAAWETRDADSTNGGVLRSSRGVALTGGIRLADDLKSAPFGIWSVRCLPLQVTPVGFALDSIFYAICVAMVILVFPLRSYLIRLQLRRKHLCVHCRYDTHGSGTGRCPECGENPSKGRWSLISSRFVWLLAGLAWLAIVCVGLYFRYVAV